MNVFFPCRCSCCPATPDTQADFFLIYPLPQKKRKKIRKITTWYEYLSLLLWELQSRSSVGVGAEGTFTRHTFFLCVILHFFVCNTCQMAMLLLLGPLYRCLLSFFFLSIIPFVTVDTVFAGIIVAITALAPGRRDYTAFISLVPFSVYLRFSAPEEYDIARVVRVRPSRN